MAKFLFILALLTGCNESLVFNDKDTAGTDDTSQVTDTTDTGEVEDTNIDTNTETGTSDTAVADDTADTTAETGDSSDTATADDTADTVEDTDPVTIVDNDGDGYGEDEDCDDYDDLVNPGAVEWCDGLDNDCDGLIDNDAAGADTWYHDADSDGYGDAADSTESCDQPTGYVADSTDCRDTSRSVHPGATEFANSVDDDCDGTIDEGTSTEDTGDVVEPEPEPEDTDVPTDDTDDTAAPEETDTESGTEDTETTVECVPAVEICGNGIDEDCDGYDDECYGLDIDADADGYTEDEDCDDTNASVNPGATELAGDLLDNDCDGTVDNGLVVTVGSTVSVSAWTMCFATSSPYDWSHWFGESAGCDSVSSGTSSVFVDVASGAIQVKLNGDRSGGWLVEAGPTVYITAVTYDGEVLTIGSDATSDCYPLSNGRGGYDLLCNY